MADLVWAAAQGDDDFEKALWLTVNRGSVGIPYLTAILRDPNCEISYKDRVLLAQFLDGDYINPPEESRGNIVYRILMTPQRLRRWLLLMFGRKCLSAEKKGYGYEECRPRL